MKSKLIKVLIACLIAGAVAAGGYYGYNKFIASKPIKAASQYITVTAAKMNMQVNVQGTGSAYASAAKDITPNNNGVLKNLNLKVGDTVKAGDTLFVSESDDLRQNANKAQNTLDKQKFSLSNAKNENEVSSINFSINDAETQLDFAYEQINKMTVKSPIGGIVTAVNYSNGDNLQQSKAVISVMDPSSMKIKVAIDELDIAKIKLGQKTEIRFDAIKGKVYEGTVDSIAPVGSSTNNVTTYDVVVAIKDPANIKVGMNGNVNILVESKENALVIPAEALIEMNDKKYVMLESGTASTTKSVNEENSVGSGQKPSVNNGQSTGASSQRKRNGQGGNGTGRMTSGFTDNGKLVEIKTGLENENYIEVLEGVTEGQKLIVTLPQSNSTTNMNNKNNLGGGFGGGINGNLGGKASGNNKNGKNGK